MTRKQQLKKIAPSYIIMPGRKGDDIRNYKRFSPHREADFLNALHHSYCGDCLTPLHWEQERGGYKYYAHCCGLEHELEPFRVVLSIRAIKAWKPT